ncbi:hypothetical protein XACG102_11260004 [Xanthomonas citri pv. citri]|nr:hypothetical protein XACG102_11260004 [Xanthomonas citri pv. citri]
MIFHGSSRKRAALFSLRLHLRQFLKPHRVNGIHPILDRLSTLTGTTLQSFALTILTEKRLPKSLYRLWIIGRCKCTLIQSDSHLALEGNRNAIL